MIVRLLTVLLILFTLPVHAQGPNPWNEDARALPRIINEQYAYLERLPGGRFALTAELRAQADAVKDENSLLDFAEKALLLLADHHAITSSSFDDSWPVVPSYSMLWIERVAGQYRISAVRKGSVAEKAGVRRGDVLFAIGAATTETAVRSFWRDLGVKEYDDAQAGFAARILVAGRRGKGAEIVIDYGNDEVRQFSLPSMYAKREVPTGVRSFVVGGRQIIAIDDALGENETIAAFDKAMATLDPKKPLIIDLSNTPSGGNTVVARAIMGWFVTRPMPYQVHSSPAEERRTGIPRQWVEQVLPRGGKYHASLPTIRVGRWTGSMGEGLAIGFHALGARVEGYPMAALLGAIEDIRLPNSGMVIKLPTERLSAVDGTPREKFVPLAVLPD